MTRPVGETLLEQVNRAKARWLNRVMYQSSATSTQKCFAYAVADHLNCVTLDCWPGLLKLSRRLGFMSIKTLQRAARGLETRGLLRISQVGSLYHFAPVFVTGDEDNFVSEGGHACPQQADNNVHESFLSILLESDSRGPSDRSIRPRAFSSGPGRAGRGPR